MDFDDDGILDFISGSYDPGDVYLFRGLGDGKYAKVEKLLDKEGVPIVHHPEELAAYSKVTDKEEKRLQENVMLRVASFGSWPAPVDWDDDGDLDLLIGSFGGGLFLRQNEGTRREPAFAAEAIPVQADGKPLSVRAHCNPVVADWDADGRWDLVVGASDGSVRWFRNVGVKSEPKFGPAKVLVPPANHQKFLKQNLGEGEDPVPGVRAQICVTDYNHDGRLDLLVGDYSDINWTRELSSEEQQKFDDNMRRQSDVGKELTEMQKLMAEARRAEAENEDESKSDEAEKPADDQAKSYQELRAEYRELIEKIQELQEEQKSFYLESRRASFVWLYLRTDSPIHHTTNAKVSASKEKQPKSEVVKKGPIKVKIKPQRVEGDTKMFDVIVEMTIEPGWHTYGPLPEDSPYRATTVELKLPDGVSTVGDWKMPKSIPYPKDNTVEVYVDKAKFTRRVSKGSPSAAPIEVVIRYQVCDEKKCLPPATIKKTLQLK